MTYSEKLRDPRWQKLSAEVKALAGWKCERCGKSDRNLQAHHKIYRRGLEPWEYHPIFLECLCDECHQTVDFLLAQLRQAACEISIVDLIRLLAIACNLMWERSEAAKERVKEMHADVYKTLKAVEEFDEVRKALKREKLEAERQKRQNSITP